MEKKYIYYHNGIKVDIVEAKSDEYHDVQISVLGDKSFTAKPYVEYRDTQLESQGWKMLAAANGSLFHNEKGEIFALGVEKSMGVVNENDDVNYNNVMGFYHNDSVPYIVPQSYIKNIIDNANVRGAIVSAFGLLNNGAMDIRGGRIGDPNRAQYVAKSGRTIVGKRLDNTIVLATFDGVTGSSGMTGYETYLFAKNILKLHNAVCMDGGGSTFQSYKNVVYNGSSRLGVNVVAIYYKEKNPLLGAKVSISPTTIESNDGTKAFIKEFNIWFDITLFTKL